MPEPAPISFKTIDLIARVDDKEYALGQAVAPIYAEFDPKADDLRGSMKLTVGEPEIAGLTGYGEKAQKARQVIEQWKKRVEAELNHPAGGTKTTP